MNTQGLLTASCFVLALIAADQTNDRCMDTADAAIERVSSWRGLRLWFDSYQDCDDGYIAEGISDTVAKWLANDWRTVPKLRAELRTRPTFLKFVLRHIDTTDDPDDLRKIVENARKRCPPGAASLCAAVAKEAKGAVRERVKE